MRNITSILEAYATALQRFVRALLHPRALEPGASSSTSSSAVSGARPLLEEALRAVSADPEPLGVCCLLKSLEAAYAIVRIARPLIEALCPGDKLASVQQFYVELADLVRAGPIDLSLKQVVVIEGLEGSGKSSVIAGLSCSYEVSVVSGPPACVAAVVRDVLARPDAAMPAIVGRAIDFISCYFVAREAAQAPSLVVIVEAGFHKCCAEAVVEGGGLVGSGGISGIISGGEPALAASSLNPEVFRWPSDLPQPSLVVYLAIKTQLRIERIAPRDVQISESAPGRDEVLQMCYSLVQGPPVVALDASMPLPQVVSLAREVIVDMFGITLFNRAVPVDTIVPFVADPPAAPSIPPPAAARDFAAEEGQYFNPDMFSGDVEAGANYSPPRTSQLHRAYGTPATSPAAPANVAASPQRAGAATASAYSSSDVLGTPPLGPQGWAGGNDPIGTRQAQKKHIQRRQSSIGIYNSFAEIKDW